MRQCVVIGLLLVVAGLTGCQLLPVDPATAAPPLMPPSTIADSWTTESLQTSRALYITKCSRCHKFHNPADYSDDEWNGWMKKMTRKARLNAEQEVALRAYLDLFRSN